MTTVYHITSVESAIEIINSKQFIPSEPHDITNLDYGLNCFILGGAYTKANVFKGEGAKIILEWWGNMVNLPLSASQLQSSVLIDQAPWRAIIRPPISLNDLEIRRVEFDDELLDKYLKEKKLLYKFLCKKCKEKYRKNFNKKINSKLRNFYINIR
ncbi:hypothetical protein [Avibacterium volantium]|uniref:hypothetical protein n=1 Tax=Avibacterium TaxID=292486 RepID=UPI003BF7BECB